MSSGLFFVKFPVQFWHQQDNDYGLTVGVVFMLLQRISTWWCP